MERHSGYIQCWDDVTGAPLDVKLLRQARALEMQFFGRMGVYAERLRKSEAKARGGKVIQGRWVDTNKGDAATPDYRARLARKEFNTGVDPMSFAAAPPVGSTQVVDCPRRQPP